jgi:hypothetical protein
LIIGDFKLEFDEWNQKFYLKEKELKTAENNFEKNKASNYLFYEEEKLCFGLLIIVFILSIVFGVLVKRLFESEAWNNLYGYARDGLWDWKS